VTDRIPEVLLSRQESEQIPNEQEVADYASEVVDYASEADDLSYDSQIFDDSQFYGDEDYLPASPREELDDALEDYGHEELKVDNDQDMYAGNQLYHGPTKMDLLYGDGNSIQHYESDLRLHEPTASYGNRVQPDLTFSAFGEMED